MYTHNRDCPWTIGTEDGQCIKNYFVTISRTKKSTQVVFPTIYYIPTDIILLYYYATILYYNITFAVYYE